MMGNKNFVGSTPWFSAEEADVLQREAAGAEAGGSLTEKQLDLIYKKSWFKLFVPKEYGGLDMELPEALRLQEALARLDGSLGWTVTLCAGASWFVGFMDQRAAQQVFSDPLVCFGGSGLATGTARRNGEGFVVNGDWKYATGAPHLTIFTANCQLVDESGPILDGDGNPVIRSFYFLRNEVEIIEDWDAMGLKATASHSFRVKELQVTQERSFLIVPQLTTLSQPIYQFPFQQFAELTLAANYLGMFRQFFDLAALSRADLQAESEAFYSVAEQYWAELKEKGAIDSLLLGKISAVCRKMVQKGYALIAQAFPKTGMRGATYADPLNRTWRDLFTASQHVIFRT